MAKHETKTKDGEAEGWYTIGPGTIEEVDQPGLGVLREAMANYRRKMLPKPAALKRDLIAGANTALANVSDGMANGVLLGVNPLYGLYATIIGPFVGGVFSSTRLMMVTTTAGASLTAGQALSNAPEEIRTVSLFAMVILSGVFMVVLGLLGMGRLTRFVSYSVTTGFLSGIAILLVLNQLPVVTGYNPVGDNSVFKSIDLAQHLADFHLWSLVLAGLTIALAVGLRYTWFRQVSSFLAIVIPSLVALWFGMDQVQVVSDVGQVTSGIPTPDIPAFRLALDVITGAASVAVVVLVQGSGVSQSVPNPDGSRSRVSQDFVAQGLANIASGFFRGLPVGGSVSTTALSVLAGARTQWASIFSGLWMLLIVMFLLQPVSYIVMPALGALLILAGVSSIKPRHIYNVSNAGWPSRLAGLTTFAATLFLPIQAAVGIGVVLSALVFVTRSSNDITVVELIKRPDGKLHEHALSTHERLENDRVTMLNVYGPLFYAGAPTLGDRLPLPASDGFRTVVILRLRGYTSIGATLSEVLIAYAEQLTAVGGRLYLSGISQKALAHGQRATKQLKNRGIQIYEATPVLGESANRALADAEAWLEEQRRGEGEEA